MRKLAGLALALNVFGATPAAAAEYWFSITGASTASGTLTTADTVLPPFGASLITAISGTYNGATITGLIPIGSYAENNNRLYASYESSYIDSAGFSFTSALGNTNIYSYLFFSDDIMQYQDRGIGGITFSISPVAPAVPEPGTWAMMLIGFGLAGAAMRHTRPKAMLRAS